MMACLLQTAWAERPDPRVALMRAPRTGGPVVALKDIQQDSGNFKRRYLITDLGSLGGSETFAYAINEDAQVVGMARLAGDTASHAVMFAGGRTTDLFPLNSEHVQTVGPTGINNTGIVASGVISGGVYAPVLMDTRNGSLLVLPCLGGVTSFNFNGVATAVNSSGDAAGYCHVDANSRHAFIHSNGVTTDIDAFGGQSAALDLNDHGAATGFTTSPAGIDGDTAFIYQDGTMKELFPGVASFGRGINNRGQVVGEVARANGHWHGFLYSSGVVTDIGSGDSPDTVAFAINDNEQIVGRTLLTFASTCPSGPCTVSEDFAFIWEGGRMAILDSLIAPHLDWKVTWAFDINNKGQIVGYGERAGKFRAFLMTPAVSQQQCRNEGWKKFEFKSQGDCVAFVLTGQ